MTYCNNCTVFGVAQPLHVNSICVNGMADTLFPGEIMAYLYMFLQCNTQLLRCKNMSNTGHSNHKKPRSQFGTGVIFLYIYISVEGNLNRGKVNYESFGLLLKMCQ